MLRPAAFISLLLLPLTLPAQTRQRVEITQASVFLHGAELTSEAKINLPKGETEVIFTNVAGDILEQSLTVGADNGVIVQSATPQNDYLADEAMSPRIQAIKDSIEILNESLSLIGDKKTVVDEQIAVLHENRKVTGNDKSLPVAELQKLLDLVSTKLNSLLENRHLLDKQGNKATERVALLNKQLEEETKKNNQTGGQIVVKFHTDKATATNIVMSYVVANAGWTPSYDLRVEKINTPVKIFCKANIYQNTGVKWNNVKLTLSTGNPNEGAEAPILAPWYLAFYTPPAPGNVAALTRENIKNLPTRNTSDFAALDPGAFQSKSGNDINMSGSRTAGVLYLVDGVQVNSGAPIVQVNNDGIAASFDIDLPYTIPSDGQPHLVSIKDYELPASYRYYAVPKLDRDAFLQARVTNWESLNLLPGITNVFYEGTYVGQGIIDTHNVKDTMNFSLGRDKKIIILREKDKDYSAVKYLGSNARKTFGYTISIRNTRQEPIDLTLQDQLPVSNDKDIDIEDPATENGVVDKDNGSVTWTLSVKPNETKKLKLSYTIKYPKDKTINNLQ